MSTERRPQPDQELPKPKPPVRPDRPDQELPEPDVHPPAPNPLPDEEHEPPLPPQRMSIETEAGDELPKHIPTAMPNYPQNDVKK